MGFRLNVDTLIREGGPIKRTTLELPEAAWKVWKMQATNAGMSMRDYFMQILFAEAAGAVPPELASRPRSERQRGKAKKGGGK